MRRRRQRQVEKKMRRKKGRRAAELELDPTLIASKQTLELLSRKNSEPTKLLQNWQRELMGL